MTRMTHDSMCPTDNCLCDENEDCMECVCQCDLIDEVREQERQQARKAADAQFNRIIHMEAAIKAAFDEGYDAGTSIAFSDFDEAAKRQCQRDTLAAAVQRVEAIPDAHWVNPNRIAAAGNKAQVIAAIKGEQT